MSSESKQALFQSPVMFAVSLLIFALAMLSLIAAVLDRALTHHVVFFCLIALWLLLGQKLVWKRLSAPWLKAGLHYLGYLLMAAGLLISIDMLINGFPLLDHWLS